MELVFSKVVAIFLLLMAGYVVGKLKLLPENADTTLTVLLIKVLTPCMILSSVTSKELSDDTVSVTVSTLLGTAFYFVVAIALGMLFCKYILKLPKTEVGTWTFVLASDNTGFMGFPITLSIFGQDIFFLMVMQNIILGVYLYSIGPILIRYGNEHIGYEKHAFGVRVKAFLSTLNNPNIIISAVAMVMLFCGWHLPDLLFESVDTMSNAVVPISMILVGIQLSQNDLLDMFKEKKYVIFSVFRMTLLPALVFLCVNWLPISSDVKLTLVLSATFPAAVVTVPICILEEKDPTDAANLVALTTLLSVVTIPIWAVILLHIYM